MVRIAYIAQSTKKEHNEASSPGPGRPGEDASWRIFMRKTESGSGLGTTQQNEKAYSASAKVQGHSHATCRS